MGGLGTIAYLYKKDILAHYGGCCVYCSRQLTPKETELDHVVAFTKGGLNTKRNAVALLEHREIWYSFNSRASFSYTMGRNHRCYSNYLLEYLFTEEEDEMSEWLKRRIIYDVDRQHGRALPSLYGNVLKGE